MLQITKTVSEWLGEVRVYDDKINRLTRYIKTHSYKYEQEQWIDKYNTLKMYLRNKTKVREAIREFNASQDVCVGKQVYKIATLLEIMKEDYRIDLINALKAQEIDNNILEEIKEQESNRDDVIYKGQIVLNATNATSRITIKLESEEDVVKA